MAEQEDALGSNPGSSKEYEFDSHQGDYHNERRNNMKLRLTDYTYMGTDGGVHDISGWEFLIGGISTSSTT